MTIDEAIEKFKFIANSDTPCPRYCMLPCDKCVDESKQLAEWLEELKFLKQWKSDIMDSFCKYDVNSFEELVANTRNKTIDDFVKFANTMPTVEAEDGEVRPMWLEEMAEQLKAGGNIELSEHSKSQGNRTGK